jgi:hypothetical protein
MARINERQPPAVVITTQGLCFSLSSGGCISLQRLLHSERPA